MGDKRRYSPDGPRELKETEYRTNKKPHVIRNPQSELIIAPAKFGPIISLEQHKQLTTVLDSRGGKQHGKPRSTDPTKNPLGGRIFDMNCSWLMYREPYNGSFGYKCGLYQQSHGQKCTHNHVDGPTATQFLLSCLRQRLFAPRMMELIEQKLINLARKDNTKTAHEGDLVEKKNTLAKINQDIDKITRNMALSDTDAQYKALAVVFNEYTQRKAAQEVDIAQAKTEPQRPVDWQCEVDLAIALFRRLPDLAANGDDWASITELFRQTNAQLFLSFLLEQRKKRVVNKISTGVVTFGAAVSPITKYEGPTSRKTIKCSMASYAAEPEKGQNYLHLIGEKDTSLGNISRGDWI